VAALSLYKMERENAMSGLVKEVVVTVHGVESHGEWQAMVTPAFGGIEGLVHVPHVYGPFGFWKAGVWLFRDREADRFYRHISALRQEYPHVRPSVIAHSFGTYIVSQALAKYPAIELDAVVLCGSIVDRNYDWATLLRGGRVRKVRNETSGDDTVVRMFTVPMVRMLIPASGPSGIAGFSQASAGLEQQHFENYEHSSSLLSTLHCQTYWFPFLRETQSFRDLCRRCADKHHPERDAALEEFSALYDGAIRRAITLAFGEASAPEWLAYHRVIRKWVILEGATGQRNFDELLNLYVRALLEHV
jgi:pimeloyl-ACP methyl ester carboxylesterase